MHDNQAAATSGPLSASRAFAAIDAVDGSSPGTRVPKTGRRLRLPRFGGAAYGVNFNDWSGYREVGLSSAWGRCSRPSDHMPSAQAPFRAVLLREGAAVPRGDRGLRVLALLVARAAGVGAYGAIDASGLCEALR